MNYAVIYISQTGFTRKYAQWIAQACHADLYALKDVPADLSNRYDGLILGSWLHAGSLYQADKLMKSAQGFSPDVLYLFCTGAAPEVSLDSTNALHKVTQTASIPKEHLFYFPGGLNYENMNLTSRLMMKAFCKFMRSKKNKTADEQIMAEMIGKSYDLSDKKWIKPLIDAINRQSSKQNA